MRELRPYSIQRAVKSELKFASKTDGRPSSRDAGRKVRAPQGRVPGNTRWRRLQGKCNRKIPPVARRVRMERRGKSSPAGRVTVPSCKPHPVQDWNGSACAFAQKWLPVRLLIIARVRRQRRAKIDGRTPMHIGRQNPAYCLLICFLLGDAQRVPFIFIN